MKFILFPPGLINYPTTSHPWELEAGVEDVVNVVTTADEVGYDYITMPDHIVMSADDAPVMGTKWPEALTTLAYCAGITKRIHMYTSVLVVPYRNPMLTAKAVATIDWLSGGRIALAIGAGHAEKEFDVLGIPFEQRGQITDEYLMAMKELWTKDVASFHGEHVSFDNLVCDPYPITKPHPPIYVGGNTKPAMRRAAKLGDGWHPWTVQARELPRCIEYMFEQPGLRDNSRPFEIIMPLSRLNVDDVTHQELGETYVPGTEEEILDELGQLRDLGTTGILTYFTPTASANEYIERITWFAEEIMPKFRD